MPADARAAFEDHDGFEPDEDGYAVTTTPFDGRITAEETDAEWALAYTVTIEVPTLDAAVAESVGSAVADGWLDTFERRLEDAPKATRTTVELEAFEVTAREGTVTVEYGFTNGSPEQAASIAKTFAEYVEGTYVEGIVPGYDYQPPVAGLLDNARSGGAEGERGGTPL